jgi:hypothetical protein
MFAIYFAWSAVAIPCVLYLAMSALLRLSLLFIVGFSVFGVFASFTFYLPELFPTRLVPTPHLIPHRTAYRAPHNATHRNSSCAGSLASAGFGILLQLGPSGHGRGAIFGGHRGPGRL